jgi:DNA-binding transcriptional ArsR family regulator
MVEEQADETSGDGGQRLDRAYAALSDPTRRAMLVALRAGDARITDLAAPLPMSFAGVSRHVGVLESAGLVRRSVRGREHWLSLRPEGLTAAGDWIAEQTEFWSRRADALAARLAATAGPPPLLSPPHGPGSMCE